MDVFSEWRDSPETMKVLSALMLVVGVLLVFTHTVFPEEQVRTSVFLFMLAISFVFVFVSYLREDNAVAGFAGLGSSYMVMAIAFVVGVGVFSFGLVKYLSIAAPLAALSGGMANILYVVIAAPVVEEIFFRGVLLFSVMNYLGKDRAFVGIVVANLAFGAFHLYAYQGDVVGVTGAFLFGLVATGGNFVFRSLGFGIGAHVANNVLAVLK